MEHVAVSERRPSRPSLMSSLHLDLETVEIGVSIATITDFVAASGLQFRDIYDIVIPARTLKHRKARKETLTPDESDKLARLIRIYDHAVKVLGERDKALHWLSRPLRRFTGRSPIHMLRTEFGARMVEEALGQMDYGMFA
jgi:putative toxin-antitoxin system antitoxin component (TIGR02293 family)